MAFAGECSVQVELQMLGTSAYAGTCACAVSVFSLCVEIYVLLGGSGFIKFRLIHVKLLQFHLEGQHDCCHAYSEFVHSVKVLCGSWIVAEHE